MPAFFNFNIPIKTRRWALLSLTAKKGDKWIGRLLWDGQHQFNQTSQSRHAARLSTYPWQKSYCKKTAAATTTHWKEATTQNLWTVESTETKCLGSVVDCFTAKTSIGQRRIVKDALVKDLLFKNAPLFSFFDSSDRGGSVSLSCGSVANNQ